MSMRTPSHNNNCSIFLVCHSLFELTALSSYLENTVNVHLDIVEHGEKIVFMYTVKDGQANCSYDLHVAQLAGISKTIIENAKYQLSALKDQSIPVTKIEAQSDMFQHQHPVIDELKKFTPDEISSKQALDILYQLCKLID